MLGVWRLQLLREVARRGTIRAAAGAMSVTPSAVSQQLRILETEAGVPLLERIGRQVRLTDAGEMLVRHADTITAAITAAESELAATQREIAGTLRVAAIPTAARAILPAVASPGSDYVIIARGGVLTRPWDRLLDDVKSALLRLAAERAGPQTLDGPALSPPRRKPASRS